MAEIWKPIKDYEGLYEISNLGRVKSLPRNGTIKTEKILIPNMSGRYARIGLRNKIKIRYSVHRLVAEAFIPNPNNLPQVDHINGDRYDNRVENLRWVTAKENIGNPVTFAKYKQKMLEYRDNERCKAVSQYSKDGVLIAVFKSTHEAERITGIPHSNISAAALNKVVSCGNHTATIRSAGGYLWKFI